MDVSAPSDGLGARFSCSLPIASLAQLLENTHLGSQVQESRAAALSHHDIEALCNEVSARFSRLRNQEESSIWSAKVLSASEFPNDVRALVLLRAMIAAANADGEIDTAELEQIETNATRLQLPESARTWLRRELKTPRNVYSIASITEQPADAVAAYIVSHLIVDHQNDAEQAFLDELAGALQLTPRMVMEIEQVLHEHA